MRSTEQQASLGAASDEISREATAAETERARQLQHDQETSPAFGSMHHLRQLKKTALVQRAAQAPKRSLVATVFRHRMVLAKPTSCTVLAVRFRVAQMLDSLVSAVNLFRLSRMLAAVVEDCCGIKYPGGTQIICEKPDGTIAVVQPRAKNGGKSPSTFLGLRVHVHSYGMTVIFRDNSR